MHILIVGAWKWPQYESALSGGLKENGVLVSRFVTSSFFKGKAGRIQLTLPFPGPSLLFLNLSLFQYIKKMRPTVVLFWRPTHILPYTVRKIKLLGIKTISYNNDDPFGPLAKQDVPWHHHYLWYWYLKTLPYNNCNFFYRSINCLEAQRYGSTQNKVLLPYFIPAQDRPINLRPRDKEKFDTDIVFVGHYENDSRTDCLLALDKAGFKLKIWSGHDWDPKILGSLYTKIGPIYPALDNDYTKALCGAKICLAFLSKHNRDTYTRRCFEIPACGKLMLAERTKDLTDFFKEDEEACFFSSIEEAVDKAKWLLSNPDIRERISKAGLKRVWADGHDVKSRASYLINTLRSCTNN